jgi:hypothetical protein
MKMTLRPDPRPDFFLPKPLGEFLTQHDEMPTEALHGLFPLGRYVLDLANERRLGCTSEVDTFAAMDGR